MPKKGHTEEQIIAALKQQESGEKTTDICRKLGSASSDAGGEGILSRQQCAYQRTLKGAA